MSPLTLNPQPQRQTRSGFSLIELVVVIAIIGILLALILPALNSTRNTVRTTEVATEIKGFEQAIQEFKTQYGAEPPSGITIYEVPANWGSNASDANLVRQLWPQFDFSIPHDFDQNGTVEADPDGDGNNGIRLSGDECLVFFLGGVDTISASGQPIANGFSSDPANPFKTGGNRVGPFREFDPDRFIDVDGDGAHSYNDPYVETVVPYMYLSSYGGRGYRVITDGDFDGDGIPQLHTAIDNTGNGMGDEVGYAVYMQKDPDSARPSDEPTTRENGEVAWKENSFQIICAGGDGIFGCPAIWSEENGLSHNFTGSEEVVNLQEARDNITNFSGGTLE